MSVLNYDLQHILKNSFSLEIVKEIPHFLTDMQGRLISSFGELKDDVENLFSRVIEYRGIPILTIKGIDDKGRFIDYYLKMEQVIQQDIKLHDKMNFLLAQNEFELSSFEDMNDLLRASHAGKNPFQNILEMTLSFLRTYIPVEVCSVFLLEKNNETKEESLKGIAGIANGSAINFKASKNWAIDSGSILGIVAINQQFYISDKIAKDKNYKPVGTCEMPANLACFPIIYNDSLLGVLNLKNNFKGHYKTTDINFILKFVTVLSHIVYSENQRLSLEHSRSVNIELGKYVSHNVVENIEEKGEVQKRGEGIEKKAVCLFCDIRSFTSISEKLEPKNLVKLLNIYFSELIPIIEKYEGTVDKLVGDMIAAFWNIPHDVSGPELKAVKAAVEMQKTMIRKVVPEWVQGGVPRVGIGIGIYSGPVIAGNLGASQLMNYTVVGDTVHNAETLESLARPGEVWISEEIHKCTEGKILKPKKIVNNIIYRDQKKTAQAYVLKPIEYPDY